MKRQTTKTLAAGLLALGLGVTNSPAWFSEGWVVCDANTNNLVDAGDTPVPGVLVVVTNTLGTYSNANWSTTEGYFGVELEDVAGSYVTFIEGSTLPPGTTAVQPLWVLNEITVSAPGATNYFLVSNPACVVAPPPPPSENTNLCWLTGGGTIKGKGKPTFTFGGNVHPGGNAEAGDGGNWNVIAHALKLHFKGEVFEIVNCGNVEGAPPGSTSPKTPYNFIEFQGVGTLKGVAGRKANYGLVYFYGRAEDLGEPGRGKDRLYLRVYTEAGETLLLISAQPGDATVVAPTPISTGNLQLHVSGAVTSDDSTTKGKSKTKKK